MVFVYCGLLVCSIDVPTRVHTRWWLVGSWRSCL